MIVNFASAIMDDGKKIKLFVASLVLLAAFAPISESANILGIFTTTSPSHNIVHMSYLRPLIERGHNVTVVTSIPLKDKNPKYHHILIPPTEARTKQMADMKAAVSKKRSLLELIRTSLESVSSFGPMLADHLKDQRFQDLMQNPDNKFDLIVGGYFFNPFYVGLAAHFRCPMVLSYANAPNSLTNSFIGNPNELAYVPLSPLFGLPDLSTFKGRLTNFMINIPVSVFNGLMDMQMEGIYNEIFSPTEYPSYHEAKKKVSLIMFNYHFTDGIVRPNVPAAIECGGIQIKDKPDPLPENLQKLFNASSEHGVIYVSFGSNLGINDINPDVVNALFKALSGLKQTVLWKWSDPKTPGTASNIHYNSWLPQDDLLQHPNLKLFITHAGKGGVTEAAYHGVPMVAVPMIADQIGNAAQMVKDGFGLQVDKKTVTEDQFKEAILEVLTNPQYTENVRRFSKLTKDRPMTPRETAVFWLEYVIRHKGAYHMQSPAVHLNTFQLYSFDVIAFILLILFLVYKLVSVPLIFVFRRLIAKFTKVQKIKKH
ncbi:UDP-glycosyltransferase UGT5-like [Eupeodes corollae]|uniref:UDP-glycosyltransferase UGT5-like n=1 Tax=Eupeodes corollae TaxID=290404 RepID=UPI0024905E64|nr:UDP-glycosyltransferase UGT5-like [Eupeodes corollae]